MITGVISNKKLNQILTELFIRARKLNHSTALSHKLFSQHQTLLDQTVHIFLVMKIPNKPGIQQIAFDNSRFYKFLQKMYCKTTFFFSD